VISYRLEIEVRDRATTDVTTIGRTDGDGPRLPLGRYLARDGSHGGDVALDCARPHAMCLVGKRGSGKSNTLALLAEGLCAVDGTVPVVVDPMGGFAGLDALGVTVCEPRVSAGAIPAREWPRLVGLDPREPAGALVWTAASERPTLAEMREYVDSEGTRPTRRVAANHLARAASWEVFAPEGIRRPTEPTVLNLAGVSDRAANAVVRAVATGLYERRLSGEGPLPWLLVDEAHVFLDGVAAPALDTLLTRGRAPGVSLVLATQRPDALPETAVSQADLLATHRLTGRADTAAVAGARGDYVDGPVEPRIPAGVGDLLVFDDATERAHSVRVSERATSHGGTAPTLGTDGYE
jgi:energy-coupling factor transporter ATP-binding protein EcfA2